MPAGASATSDSQCVSYCFIVVIESGIVSAGAGQPNVSLASTDGFDFSEAHHAFELATIAL